MFNIGGRGGVGTSFLGLFLILFQLLMTLLYWELVAIAFVGVLIFKSIQLLYRRRKQRKQLQSDQETLRSGPPRPVMTPVEYRKDPRG
jgi:hypothetical protein